MKFKKNGGKSFCVEKIRQKCSPVRKPAKYPPRPPSLNFWQPVDNLAQPSSTCQWIKCACVEASPTRAVDNSASRPTWRTHRGFLPAFASSWKTAGKRHITVICLHARKSTNQTWYHFIASSPILKTLNVLLINCVKAFNVYKRQLSKYRQNRKLFVFFVWVKKITKNLRIFNPRHCYQALDLRSGIRKKRTYSGSRIRDNVYWFRYGTVVIVHIRVWYVR